MASILTEKIKLPKKFGFIIMLILALIIGGCSTTQTPNEKHSSSSTENPSNTTYPLTVIDDTDMEITLEQKPERIVCLAPASTEILFALGLEGKVVAVTKYDKNPEGVQEKVEYVFDDSQNPNVEKILDLNPDLIILGMHDEKTISNMRKLGVPVVQLNPQSIEATYETIEQFGLITDTQDEAKNVIESMKKKEQAIYDKIAHIDPAEYVRVWIEIDPDMYTAGEGTFLNELITKAGGINVAKELKGYGKFNEEQLLAANPHVILETYSYYMDNVKESILGRRGWEEVEAIKNKRVFSLDSDMVTRPGPRIIDGLESIAQVLYPDLF